MTAAAWAHLIPTILAAFSASAVEFVEALTVVLAVGVVRGWRGAVGGGVAALLVLAAMILVLGPALQVVPLAWIRRIIGALMLLFGLRWLCKASLRAAGVIPLHDETKAFARAAGRLRARGRRGAGFDRAGFAAAFQVTMLEGVEVAFIVLAIGAGGGGLLVPAVLGALAALVLVLVTILGVAVHRPLTRIPENTLKFVVGVLLSAFGCFWFGEGVGVDWVGGDWAIAILIAGFALTALTTARLAMTASRRSRA
jgi:uncharacterized membrane protein